MRNRKRKQAAHTAYRQRKADKRRRNVTSQYRPRTTAARSQQRRARQYRRETPGAGWGRLLPFLPAVRQRQKVA